MMTREDERWERIEKLRIDDEDRAQNLRDIGLASKKNTSHVSYNIL